MRVGGNKVIVVAALAALLLTNLLDPGAATAAPRADQLAPADAALTALPLTADVSAQRGSVRCDQLATLVRAPSIRFAEAELRVTSTELDGGATPHLCVFYHPAREVFWAFLPNVTSGEHFRERKAALLPALADAGIDPCRVAFWSPVTREVQDTTTMRDWHDAGRFCAPLLRPHGPASEARAPFVQQALDAAIAKGEELFGWSPTWPFEVHYWDDTATLARDSRLYSQNGFGGGNRVGVVAVNSLAMTVMMLDTPKLKDDADLAPVIAHEYGHILQWGVIGCSCALPHFFTEGGADYFAALVVGSDDDSFAFQWQKAREEVRVNKAKPLTDLIRDTDRTDAPYTRGYAAVVFLTTRWGGVQALIELYRAAQGDKPDAALAFLATYTGLPLTDFDAALNEYLRDNRLGPPVAGPGATIAPSGVLLSLTTVPLRDRTEGAPTDRITAADTALAIRYALDCVTAVTNIELTVFQPDGRRHSRGLDTAQPSCLNRTGLRLELDDRRVGPSVRSQPGEWRVEVLVNGQAQGEARFIVTP